MSFFCPFSGAAQAGMSVSAQGGAKQKRVPFSRPGLAGTMAMTTGGRMLPACGGLLDARLADRPPRGGRTYAQLRQGPAFRRLRCPAQQPCPVRYTDDPDPEIPKKKTKGWGNMSKTRMGKRVASLLLSLVMMLSLLPTTVYATEGADTGDITDEIVGQANTSSASTEGTDESKPTGEGGDDSEAGNEGETSVTSVAQVGDAQYATLEEAVKAADSGATVSLLDNVTLDTTLTVAKNITIDVGGFTLTVATSGDGIIVENATLTLTGAADSKYVFDCTNSNSDGIYVLNNEDGTTSTLNIEGGVEIVVNPSVNSAVHVFGKAGNAAVNMSGGKISVSGSSTSQFSAVLIDQSSTMNMTGGEIAANIDFTGFGYFNDVVGVLIHGQNAVQRDSHVTISGGKISVGGKNAFAQGVQVGEKNYSSQNCTVKFTGGEINVNATESGQGYAFTAVEKPYADIEMSGGTISGAVTALTLTQSNDKANLTITGGTITSGDPTEYLAEGKTLNESGNVVDKAPEVKPVTVNGVGYDTLDDAIKAVQNGEIIVVNAGEYELPSSQTLYAGKAFTIEAAKGAEVFFDMTNAVTMGSAKVTFNNVTFDYKTNSDYKGLQHSDTLVYNNCVINGEVTLYANSETFNDCTFNAVKNGEKAQYNVWTYSAKAVKFNNCTFKCDGKAVNAYIEAGNAGTTAQQIVVKDCIVASSKTDKAFLNIKNTQHAYEVVFEGATTVKGLNKDATTGSNLFQVETTTATETSGKTVKVQEKATDGTLTTIYEVKKADDFYKDEAGVWHIANAQGLVAFSNAAAAGTTFSEEP